jgi:membrane-associated HD superfamily phosphohydrolase
VSPNPRYRNDRPSQALTVFGDLPVEVRSLLGESGRKIMRRLCREAPGTFMHCAHVLELMQAAGYAQCEREIAATMTHDIGKLIAPPMFAENASRDLGKPCAWMMAGHVDFGFHLAQDAQLDDLSVAAILQHHGTQRIEGDIRYSGQIPGLEFTCALMMADTFEAMASSHCLTLDAAWNVHTRRIRDGQFDEIGAWHAETITRDLLSAAGSLSWLGRSEVA